MCVFVGVFVWMAMTGLFVLVQLKVLIPQCHFWTKMNNQAKMVHRVVGRVFYSFNVCLTLWGHSQQVLLLTLRPCVLRSG